MKATDTLDSLETSKATTEAAAPALQAGIAVRPASNRRALIVRLTMIVLLIAAVAADRFGFEWGALNLRTELVAGGLLFAVVAAWPATRSKLLGVRAWGMAEWCLIGWLAANTISSSLFSPRPGESLKFTVAIAGIVAVYFAFYSLIDGKRAVTWAAVAWVAIGAGVCAIGLVDALLYIFTGWTDGIWFERLLIDGIFNVTPKVHGVLWEPNIFGSYSLTVGMLAFALAVSPRFRHSRWSRWLGVAVALSFCGVMLSMTRTVWALAPLFLLIAGAACLKWRLATPRQVGVALVLPAFIGVTLGLIVGNSMFAPRWQMADPWSLSYQQVERMVRDAIRGNPLPAVTPFAVSSSPQQQTTPAAGATQVGKVTTQGGTSALKDRAGEVFSSNIASVESRGRIFSDALDGWSRSPLLGWGAGAFPFLYPPPPEGGYWIANMELHVLFDTGITGLVLLAAAIIVTAHRGVLALRLSSNHWATEHYIIFGLLLGGLGLLLAYQVTEGTWLGFTWVFFGLLVAAGRFTASENGGGYQH